MSLFSLLSSAFSISMASLLARRGVTPVSLLLSSKRESSSLRAVSTTARAQQQHRRRRAACQAAADASTTSTSPPLPPSPALRPSALGSLIGMPLDDLEEFVVSQLEEPKLRARQLYRWLYSRGGARVLAVVGGGGSGSSSSSSPSSSSSAPNWSEAPGPQQQDGFSSAFLEKVSSLPALLDSGIELTGVLSAADGTRKLLFKITSGAAAGSTVDAVLIPSYSPLISSSSSTSSSPPSPRLTLCVSSQAGCAMGCAFCLTGARGLKGSLSSAQIVGQLVAARQLLRSEEEEDEEERRGGKGLASMPREISNVVFMGQGEPLDNLDAVVDSVKVMTDARAGGGGGGGTGGERGGERKKESSGGASSSPSSSAPPAGPSRQQHQWSLSPNRVTVSTVGLVPQLRSLVSRCDAQVALSLHAASEETRAAIVPATARHGVEEMRLALEELFPRRRRQDEEESGGAGPSSATTPGRGKRRHVLIEMTLLSGINDSDEDAELLLDFLSEIEAKVNLIPWNPHPGSPFSPPDPERVEAFRRVVQQGGRKARGKVCTVRMARGADEAMAACGQLGEVGRVPRAAARFP